MLQKSAGGALVFGDYSIEQESRSLVSIGESGFVLDKAMGAKTRRALERIRSTERDPAKGLDLSRFP